VLASSTTEGQNGGNIRSSSAAIERSDAGIALVFGASLIIIIRRRAKRT